MSLPKLIDGRLELVDIPVVKEDGTFLLAGGMFHVDPSHELFQPLTELYAKKPGMFHVEQSDDTGFTKEQLAAAIRLNRDELLRRSDWTMTSDNGLSETKKSAYRAYRQALRDFPQEDGFPWDGGGPKTPWPVL